MLSDVNILFDENYVNLALLEYYENPEMIYSLKTAVKDMLPEVTGFKAQALQMGLKSIFSVLFWSSFFPSLHDKYAATQEIDFKCFLNKENLEGKL